MILMWLPHIFITEAADMVDLDTAEAADVVDLDVAAAADLVYLDEASSRALLVNPGRK